jgi:biopolymer transport protein ExbD
MSWKLRHEGSPSILDGLTPGQIAKGLEDGHWGPTDEVMGPTDTGWIPIEVHPAFANLVADLEPPEPAAHEDETHIDMTPLIDVCLVLLIFAILSITYKKVAEQKVVPQAEATSQSVSGPPKVTKAKVQEFMISVKVRQEKRGGSEVTVYEVENEPVEREALVGALAKYVKNSRKTDVLIDHGPRVPFGAVFAVQDAARGAGCNKVLTLVPKEEIK